jgi:hypothetical protein
MPIRNGLLLTSKAVFLAWIIHEGIGVGLRHVTACGRLREQPAAARPRPTATHSLWAGPPAPE